MEDNVSMNGGEMVSEWFKHITFIVHCVFIIATSAPPQIIPGIRSGRLGDPCLQDHPHTSPRQVPGTTSGTGTVQGNEENEWKLFFPWDRSFSLLNKWMESLQLIPTQVQGINYAKVLYKSLLWHVNLYLFLYFSHEVIYKSIFPCPTLILFYTLGTTLNCLSRATCP